MTTRHHSIIIGAAALMLTLLGACSHSGHNQPEQYAPVEVTRLDSLSAAFGSLNDSTATAVYAAHRPLLNSYLSILNLDTANAVGSLRLWSGSLPVAMFAPAVDSVFVDTLNLGAMIGNIAGRVRAQGIDVPARHYAAVVWGRNESILFDGDNMFVALNHYLGAHHPAYANWADYRRAMKRPDMLPYDITEALIAVQQPYTAPEGGENVLSRMAYEGALAEAKMRIVDNATLDNALGFTPQQLADIQTNEQIIWQQMLNNKLLYSTDAEVLHRLFALLPYSTPISQYAPGRTARYTGWRIVRAYLERHPDTSIEQLLSPAFYNDPDLLRKSGYTGRDDK